MTLFVHRATSTGALAEGLAELLATRSDDTGLGDPFAEEVVAVPAKGVERWLAQRLSHTLGAGAHGDDGVCAGVRFLNPHSLVALVLGIERDDPWHPDQLAWPVLRAVDTSLGEPWAHTLSVHLGYGMTGTEGELRRGRRYAVASRLAGLFASYAAQRPAMVADWAAGGSGDGIGGQVADDLSWQPELWRRVLELVEAESPMDRQQRVVAALRAADPAVELDLPGRLSLFGHTRIARSEIEVLTALAEHRDVHLWLPQASPQAWESLVESTSAGPVPRHEDASGLVVRHPLLASLGRDSRELQRTLALAGGHDDLVRADAAHVPPAPYAGRNDTGSSLLALLQADIAADHAPTDLDRAARVIGEDDRSIQVHACHGQARQVEVLRDVLVGLLADDPTLEPRDVLVMCPDIDHYAPLVHAGFGLGEIVGREGGEAHPAHGLRVRLADRAPMHTNPLIALAVRLVELAGSRLTASEVLDVVRSAPVRQRFGLDDDDLERISDWADAVTIRWGLDATHRSEHYQLPNLAQNTWRAGLDRVLVGAAVDGVDTDHLGTVLALDDLDSGDLDLAGRFAELIERLGHTLQRLRDADRAQEWVTALKGGVLDLADAPVREAWQVAQLERELDRIGAGASRTGTGSVSLTLADVRALLTERSAGRATRSNFRTGSLTVCTMVPMRSVPHRVVCLVGMDDGIFPRTTTPDGDDALARRPVTGERDPRSEDRQLLLDAVMSAGQTLVVTYTGFDAHTGQERPPAVPLGELLDALGQTASGPGLDRIVTAHPLQPFDARNLGPGAGGEPLLPGGRAFSHDPTALDGARALTQPQAAPSPLAQQSITPLAREDVALDDLLRFFDNPAKAFLRGRVGMLLPEVPEQRGEGLPIELDGLQRWKIGDRILQAVMAGRDPAGTVQAELWRGELPPDALGERTMKAITEDVQALAEATWRTVGRGGWGEALPRESVDVDIPLADGRRLTGTVSLVDGHALTVTYSSVRAKQQLRTWITALVLAAGGPDGATSHLIGRHSWGRASKGPGHLTYGAAGRARAIELLDELIDLRDRGLDGVLPLPVDTSRRWAERYLKQGREDAAQAAAGYGWHTRDGGFGLPGEQDDDAWLQVLGGRLPLDLVVGTAGEDELWTPGVTSRLGQLALRVWRPALEVESMGRP